MTYTAGFDGSATPNPGEMKIGTWINTPEGKRLHTTSLSIGHGTNNEAEYTALLALLAVVRTLKIKDIKIQGDSLLVVNQVNGKWKAKNPKMKEFRDHAQELLEGIDNWELTHVLRDKNSEADALTR